MGIGKLIRFRSDLFGGSFWSPGRNNTGYEKHAFAALWWRERLLLDFGLIRYSHGSYIPEHTDPEVRYRINFVALEAVDGGVFKCSKFWRRGRLIGFDPRLPHSVSEVIGARMVLTFGLGFWR